MKWWRFAVILLIFGTAAAPADDTSPGKQFLSDYLDALNRQGTHRIVYSSDLVVDAMRVEDASAGNPSPDELRAILQPFGLAVEPGPSGSLLVVQLAKPDAAPIGVAVQGPQPIPEVIVTSSLHRLQYSSPQNHTYLDRDLATRTPTTGDEALRIVHRLPGISAGGVSSQSHIRGGEVNEVLFLFDGLRLYEPYHLKDFQSVATIVNSNAIGGIDVFTGAYPARYGDRMSGVNSIEMREANKPRETEIAVSFFNTSILSLGRFGDDARGDWLLAARRGNLDLIADVIDPEVGSPDYRDFLAHAGWEFGPRATVAANILWSDDKLKLADPDSGEQARARYTNRVFWAKWQADWTRALQSQTLLAVSDIADSRIGVLSVPGIVSGSLDERREFNALEFRQDWIWRASRDWMLQVGANIKNLDAVYQTSLLKTVEPPFDSVFGNEAITQFDYNVDPAGAQYAAYAELRWRASGNVVFDVGLRWDQQNYTTSEDDKQYSPRASVLYQPGQRTDLRFGWGQYYQAQEINELQVSDGITTFFPAQRAEHFVASLSHEFENDVGLSVSLYRKSFRTLRPRFENALNVLTLLPELQFDRIEIVASGAEAVGAEVTLIHGTAEDDLLWWLSYAWSSVDDETAEGTVPRSWDQAHTAKAGLSWRWSKWNFSVSGEVHTGWPHTDLTGELVAQPSGGQALALTEGQRNAGQFPPYHSLDMRISREFSVARGSLTGFLEVSNLYNRRNPCCFEYELLANGELQRREDNWLPLVPSLGIVWAF